MARANDLGPSDPTDPTDPTGGPWAPRPIRVLMVEDDVDDVFLTETALRRSKLHLELQVVGQGSEALAALGLPGGDARRPDLVLLDLTLPDMDGRQVLTAIKTNPLLANVPVMVLTASAAEEDLLRSFEHSADGYLTKPLGIERFREAVDLVDAFWFTIVVQGPDVPEGRPPGRG